MPNPTVLVNIVLYNPDKNKALDLIHICSQYPQATILLFDNSANSHFIEPINVEKVILFRSEKNIGIAGAHYYACKMAENDNFDFVLFLDQDSQLPSEFINDMVFGFYRLQKHYPRLCAIGPSWRDSRICNWYREKKLNNSLKTKVKAKLKAILKVNQRREKMHHLLRLDHILISSGMLIWIPTLKKIGYPRKEYFIDLVDIEWCLRALAKNYQVEMVRTIQIQHTIGQFKTLKNSFLQYQDPMRYYYSIRNSFFLFREKQFPLLFRFFILTRNIMEMKKIPFVPEPAASFLAALRGLKDGFLSQKSVSIDP